MIIETTAAWLITVAVQAGVLLGIAWWLDRGPLRARPAWRELAWRAALFGSVLSASAQLALDPATPFRYAWNPQATATPMASPAVSVDDDTARAAPGPTPAIAAAQRAKPPVAVRDASKTPIADAPNSVAWTLPALDRIVVAFWLAGALIALARIALGWIRLESLLRRAERLDDGALRTDADALAIEAGARAPSLAVSDDIASPIAAPGRRIVLPRWSIEMLDREQLRAMLAHETAHVARRDPAWKCAIALWNAVFWFVPLGRTARRRLDEIAELECDAWTACHLGDGRSLAECLAECAERRVGGFETALAPAMASRESQLVQRIDQLIAGATTSARFGRGRAVFVVTIALAIAAVALPGIAVVAAPPEPPAPPPPPAAPPAPPSAPVVADATSGHHVHISSEVTSSGTHDLTVVQLSHDGRSYSAKIEGKIAFNDAENGIASLGDGGSAMFSEARDGTTRRLEVKSRGGKIERRYFVDDDEHAIDADAERWIAEVIPTVIRETALDAGARVRRIRAHGGAPAVLDEIARIESGYARGVYLGELVKSGKLSTEEMTRALKLVDGLDSDYTKRTALTALIKAQPLDAVQQRIVLADAATIDSDYERAELLLAALPGLAPDDGVRAAWLKAAEGIGSGYERRRTLTAVLDAGAVDEASLANVVDAARTIDSDYDRRELLSDAARHAKSADAIAGIYTKAVADLGSSYEKRTALEALMHAKDFGKAGASAVLDVASDIGSDYDCREVLVELARVMPDDAELIKRYRGVARGLSNYERGEAERALDRFDG